jgi:hypothetical protein
MYINQNGSLAINFKTKIPISVESPEFIVV